MGESHSRGSSKVDIPPWLLPVLQGSAGQLQQAQGTLPSVSQLYGGVPKLGVGDLSSSEQDLIGQITARGGSSADLDSAEGLLASLTGGNIGSSPATAAGMKAFSDLIAPQISQTAALAGQANGGGILEAMQHGSTEAAVPLIQQEIANREAAIGQYGALDAARGTNLNTALTAAGMPRQVGDEQQKAEFEKLMAQFNLAQGVQMGPEQLFGSALGQQQRGVQYKL